LEDWPVGGSAPCIHTHTERTKPHCSTWPATAAAAFSFFTPGQTSRSLGGRACNVASDGNDGWCAMVINPSIPAARAVTQYALVVSIFIVRTEATGSINRCVLCGASHSLNYKAPTHTQKRTPGPIKSIPISGRRLALAHSIDGTCVYLSLPLSVRLPCPRRYSAGIHYMAARRKK
jgi:hypothetical protein